MADDKPLAFADFFVLRAPSLPQDALDALRGDYDDGIAISHSALMQDGLVREALFLASHNLHARLAEPGMESDHRFQLSLARYLTRMATRPTPFGLFAGVALGDTGGPFSLAVDDIITRVCRIDQGAMSQVQARLFGSGALAGMEVRPNASLWHAPDGLRYVETHLEGGTVKHKLARMERTGAIDAALGLLEAGKQDFDSLTAELAQRFDAAPEAARGFVLQLVQEQILVLAPALAVTGDDVTRAFSEQLSRLPGATELSNALTGAIDALGRVGNDPPANIAAYEAAAAKLKEIDPAIDGATAIQVDLHRTARAASLPTALLSDIAAGLWALRPLLVTPVNEELRTLATAFVERFGDAAVPLLLALDEDFGIRVGRSASASSVLEGISSSPRHAGISASPADVLLLGLAQEAMRNGASEIVLDDSQLRDIAEPGDDLPSSFAALGAFSRNGDELRFNLTGLSGVPASALLGRFCCGDAALTEHVRALIAQSEGDRDDVVVAEIVHLPEGRVGNVMLRPVLRAHEVTYLGQSGAPAAAQIPATDLMLSCVGGRFVLTSARLNKRVIPRITNAHAFATDRSLPVYRFLGLLQHQNEPRPRPVWGELADKLGVLPAVRYRGIRLAFARHRLSNADTKAAAKCDTEETLRAFLDMRRIGRKLRVQQGDNYLELDLAHALDRALLLEECRRKKTVVLEVLPDEDFAVARDAEGHSLRQEVVIPMIRAHPADRLPALPTAPPRAGEASAKWPGRDWLYARVFAGPAIQDRLVTGLFPAFAELAGRHGGIKPFFLRYDDGGAHLRLRVQGTPDVVWQQLRQGFEALLAPYLESGEVSRFEYATYHPEIVRYGGTAGIDACEHIFSADSTMAAGALSIARDETERWTLALASLTGLLRLLAPDREDQARILDGAVKAYLAEFRIAEPAALNDRYRALRQAIDAIVETGTHPNAEIEHLLGLRNAQIAPFAEKLRTMTPPPDSLVQSLLHMAVNRLLFEQARLQEMVLLHFIAKSAASFEGRRKFARKTLTQSS